MIGKQQNQHGIFGRPHTHVIDTNVNDTYNGPHQLWNSSFGNAPITSEGSIAQWLRVGLLSPRVSGFNLNSAPD